MSKYISNQVVGVLTLVSRHIRKVFSQSRHEYKPGAFRTHRYRAYWDCTCQCGRDRQVDERNLVLSSKTCRCNKQKKPRASQSKRPFLPCDCCGRRHKFPYRCRLKEWQNLIAALPTRMCLWCDAEYKPSAPNQKFCTPKCEKKHRKCRRGEGHKKRARKMGLVIENFNAKGIFDRDGWKCQICGIDTPKELRGTGLPNSPELDHINPLSLGGSHTPKNTRCACKKCNAERAHDPRFFAALRVYKATPAPTITASGLESA